MAENCLGGKRAKKEGGKQMEVLLPQQVFYLAEPSCSASSSHFSFSQTKVDVPRPVPLAGWWLMMPD